METPSRNDSPDSRPRSGQGRGRVRAGSSFGERQRARRTGARRLIAARTTRPLTPAQQAFDPLGRGTRSPGQRVGYGLLVVLASVAVHLGAVGLGLLLRGNPGTGRLHEEVTIELRSPPPPPPPPEKKPPPEPPPPIEKPTRPLPKLVKAPPPLATPEPPPKVAPVRIVGLSLESTTEGGSGPAFAVGNTRMGETDTRAKAPKDVGPAPAGTSPLPAAGGPGTSNQIATRIPVAGIAYTDPRPRGGKQKKPPYPPLLRSQGIEGSVTVMVTIDETGGATNVKILRSSTYPDFDEAARRAALEQEWEPATKAGVPMSRTISYPYRFTLDDE